MMSIRCVSNVSISNKCDLEICKILFVKNNLITNLCNEISFIVWNAKYPTDDVKVYTQSVHLDYFQFALFNNIDNLTNRIEIVDESNSIKIPEF